MAKKSSPESTACTILIFCSIAIIWLPVHSFYKELEFHDRMFAFHEVEDHLYTIEDCRSDLNFTDCLNGFVDLSSPFHFVSSSHQDDVTGSVYETDFGFSVHDTLELKRVTEYCQWHQTSVHTKKSTTYFYHKSWSLHRINSLLFNQVNAQCTFLSFPPINDLLTEQPASHYNPQRDPFPSKTFLALDARVGGVPLLPSVLHNAHGGLRAATSTVNWTLPELRDPPEPAVPRPQTDDGWLEFLGFRSDGGRRTEDVAALANFSASPAATVAGFEHVGGGYFFSPIEGPPPSSFWAFLKARARATRETRVQCASGGLCRRDRARAEGEGRRQRARESKWHER